MKKIFIFILVSITVVLPKSFVYSQSVLSNLQFACATTPPGSQLFVGMGCDAVAVPDPVVLCPQISQATYPDTWARFGCSNIAQGTGTGITLPPPSISTNPTNTGSAATNFPSSKIKTTCAEFNMNKPDLSSLPNVLGFARCFIGSLFPLLLLIGLAFFLYNITQYVIRPNPLKNNERRQYIIWGVVGLFVVISLWGLVYFVSSTLGLGNVVPQIPITK